jgi:nicotinamidase-related amidase
MAHPLTAARDRSVVALLDLQGRLMENVMDREAVAANTIQICRVAGIVKVPVLATEQNSKSLGHTMPQIREALPAGSRTIEKIAFSAFGEEGFAKALAETGRTHLVVCGIMSHVCVCQSVLDGVAAGYTVHVVGDAVSCWKELDHHAGLDKMRQAGAVITSTELVIYEWLERAGTDAFRAALPFLKHKPSPPKAL